LTTSNPPGFSRGQFARNCSAFALNQGDKLETNATKMQREFESDLIKIVTIGVDA
jgi:hypothetical protein